MKASFVRYILGLAWLALGGMALVFAGLALVMGESPRGFLFTAVLGAGLGLLLRGRTAPSDEPKTAEALVASGLLWLALPVLAEDVVLDGPPGNYRFVASFERGALCCRG